MQALVLYSKNSEPVLTDLILDSLKAGYVEIELRAAALNHRDVWIQKGQYARLTYPIVPGSDGAGFLNGKAVIINPGLHWGNNERFQSSSFQILGMPDHGTFSQKVHVPETQVYPMPEHLSFEEAAAIPLAGVTAFRATVNIGQLHQNDRVLITGIGGGVALWACQFALSAGAEVWVTSGSDNKLARAKRLGIQGGFNYKDTQWASKAKDIGGFDLIIDGAGGPSFTEYVKLANPGGRIVCYGGTGGQIGPFLPQPVFWKQLQINGSTMGSPKDFEQMLDWINLKKLVPVIDQVFPLQQGPKAYKRMSDSAQFGKIILQLPT